MGINKYYLVIICSFIFSCTIFSTCKKGGLDCANAKYNFQLSATIYPDSASIHLGDTIWLMVSSPVSFKDEISNNLINYSGAANLGSAIGFGEYSIISNPVVAANSFTYVLIIGSKVSNPNTAQIREYLFFEQDNMYVFKLGIIPLQKGIFGIGLSNAQNVYRKFDECTKAYFLITLINTHQHYYLNPNINSSNSDTTKPSGSYYFKVN